MNTYIFTFGSSQLPTISSEINPMSIMLIIDAVDEEAARSIVFHSFIGERFCTSYPISMQGEFSSKYGMVPYRLRELESIHDSVVNSHLR